MKGDLAKAQAALKSAKAKAEAKNKSHYIHAVKEGEDLASIAIGYDVPLSVIIEANGLQQDSKLEVGDNLVIPAQPEGSGAKAPEKAAAVAPTPKPIVIERVDYDDAIRRELPSPRRHPAGIIYVIMQVGKG